MNLSRRTSLTTLAALCSVAAIGPATASAHRLVTYDVQVDSSTSYNLTQQTRDDLSSFNAATRFSWSEAADVGQVEFLDGYLWHGSASLGSALAEGHSEEIRTRKGSPTQSGTCDIDLDKEGSPLVRVGKPDSVEGQDESVAVSVSNDDVDLDWKCQGQIGSYIPEFGSKPIDPEGEFGQRPMDATFTVPRDIVGYGKIIQQIHGPGGRSKGYCPEEYAEGVTKCEFGWDGEVTFTKVGDRTIGDPAPKPDEREELAPLVKPAAEQPEELVPLIPVQAKAAVDAKASTVSFTAQCPAGCSGTAALTVPVAKAGASASAKGAKPVARMAFSVKARRKAQTIRLKLPAKARRALKRARRGSLRVTVRHRGGRAVSRTLKVRVPRR